MNFDYAVHSDFLIHWTGGKDIDERDDGNDLKWYKSEKSTTTDGEAKSYIQRLKDILEFGLWMTEDDGEDFILPTPKTCFTEVKNHGLKPVAF